jgi:hypothetical protein
MLGVPDGSREVTFVTIIERPGERKDGACAVDAFYALTPLRPDQLAIIEAIS